MINEILDVNQLSDESAGLAARWQREHGRADWRRPAVQQIKLSKPALHGRELHCDVGLIGSKDEPGVGWRASACLGVAIRPAQKLRPGRASASAAIRVPGVPNS